MLEVLRLEIKKLRTRNELHELEIMNLRKQLKIAEVAELAKVSPAEEWLSKETGSFHKTNTYDHEEMIEAHEAGQEYAAEKEAEKYGPLVTLTNEYLDYHSTTTTMFNWKFKEAIENLNHKPEEKQEIKPITTIEVFSNGWITINGDITIKGSVTIDKEI